MVNSSRRVFLRYLVTSGLVLPGFLKAETAMKFPDWIGSIKEYREKTMSALIEAMFPGALKTGALEVFKTSRLLDMAIQNNLMPPPPPLVLDNLWHLDSFMKEMITKDLDIGVALQHKFFKRFIDIPLDDQIKVIKERQDNSLVAPLYQVVRAICLFSMLGTPINDEGFIMIGLPKFENFEDGLHNRGFKDYSYNEIPERDGIQVWDELMDGDLP
jgi:hypothetical protein